MGQVTRHWCRLCGQPVQRIPNTYRWVHVQLGTGHGPIPTTRKPEVAA